MQSQINDKSLEYYVENICAVYFIVVGSYVDKPSFESDFTCLGVCLWCYDFGMVFIFKEGFKSTKDT